MIAGLTFGERVTHAEEPTQENSRIDHTPCPGDTTLEAYRAAGLQTACIVCLKAFTLDNRLILKTLGNISAADRQKIAEHLRAYVL